MADQRVTHTNMLAQLHQASVLHRQLHLDPAKQAYEAAQAAQEPQESAE